MKLHKSSLLHDYSTIAAKLKGVEICDIIALPIFINIKGGEGGSLIKVFWYPHGLIFLVIQSLLTSSWLKVTCYELWTRIHVP